ncbi:MAG: hypothetical protein FJW96_01635 [Actinobacteria bacterium]|nr:hypothetical protein [Actinomycetota bacterium]
MGMVEEKSLGTFVDRLAAARVGATFNQYATGPRAALLRERLTAYLKSRGGARILLVGEAAGYRGARVSGLPFTSERQLTGAGPAEATATIVQGALRDLGAVDDVLLWNAVPTHPGSAASNRSPTAAEVGAGAPFLEELAQGRVVIPVGRVAERACGLPGIRHPARGGAAAFRDGLAERLRSLEGTAIIQRRSVSEAFRLLQ